MNPKVHLTRFYYTDPITGCWRWTGTKRGGYGMIHNPNFKPKMIQASRYTYELYKGPIPAGLDLDHLKEKCPYRDCVNPDHLEPVTNQENIRRGKRCIITVEIAKEIRDKYYFGLSQKELSALYGISQPTVSQIIRRMTWK